MKTYKAQPYNTNKYLLGEAPFYDVRNGWRSFVDIIAGKLYIIDADGNLSEKDFGQRIGAAVPMTNAGEYFVAATDGLYRYDGKDISLIRSLKTTYESYQRSNDAKADPEGRVWFGSVSEGDDHEAAGNLYRFDGSNIKLIQPATKIANGMAWNKARDKFFFSDSLFYAVFSYDYDNATGDVTNRKVLFNIEGGVPDGMCIDSDDNLWVAVWGGRRIEKHSSVTGELLGIVEVPAENVTSCCFFGDKLDKLFITSSGEGLSGEFDGCLFTCDVDSVGLPADLAK